MISLLVSDFRKISVSVPSIPVAVLALLSYKNTFKILNFEIETFLLDLLLHNKETIIVNIITMNEQHSFIQTSCKLHLMYASISESRTIENLNDFFKEFQTNMRSKSKIDSFDGQCTMRANMRVSKSFKICSKCLLLLYKITITKLESFCSSLKLHLVFDQNKSS